jgi:hypothetical protein
MPVDEMVDVVEPDQADEDQIERDDIVEEPRHDQNQYAGNEGDKRRDVSGGDNHEFSLGFVNFLGFVKTDRQAGRGGRSARTNQTR